MNISFRFIFLIAIFLQDLILSLRAKDMSLVEPITATSLEIISPNRSTTTIKTTNSIVSDTWKLLVIGGMTFEWNYISDVEKIDPNKMSSKCEKPMPYPTLYPTYGHTAQAFPDQSVLSCGGSEGHPIYLNSCYEYNPIDLNWSYVTNMIYYRYIASSVLLNDNEMWVVGGSPGRGGYTSEIYDKNTKTFRKGPHIPVHMFNHCMVKLNETHVFIGGGESIDQQFYYDSSFLVEIAKEPFVFHMLPKMSKSRNAAGCGIIRSDSRNGNMNRRYNTSKGLIIMAGGINEDDDVPGDARRDSEIFNIQENKWFTGPMMPRCFKYGGSASLGDGSMVIIGGKDEKNKQQSDIIRLNPSLMEFETMAGELQTARSDFAMAVLLDNEDC